MGALGASNVAFTVSGNGKINVNENGTGKSALMKIVFGDGSSTYPSGGIPLSGLSSAGFPNVVRSVDFIDHSNSDGYVYKWDAVNNKIRIYRSAGFTPAGTNSAPAFTGSALATHTHDMLAKGGLTSSEALFLDASQSFGKNAATDRTIVGSTSATTGGVVSASAGTPAGTVAAPVFTGTAVAAGALAEVTTAFVPASNVTLYANVSGF